MIRPSATPPTRKLSRHLVQTFRVWSHQPLTDDDSRPYRCIASFYYLSCALDYIADCQDKGVTVWFQSPRDVRKITPSEDRVVYKPATAAN